MHKVKLETTTMYKHKKGDLCISVKDLVSQYYSKTPPFSMKIISSICLNHFTFSKSNFFKVAHSLGKSLYVIYTNVHKCMIDISTVVELLEYGEDQQKSCCM